MEFSIFIKIFNFEYSEQILGYFPIIEFIIEFSLLDYTRFYYNYKNNLLYNGRLDKTYLYYEDEN
jgi:hypothetical protein